MAEPMVKQATAAIPTKEQIKAMPAFPLLARDKITLVSSAAQAEQVCTALMGVAYCGFDTESKALFKPGEVSDGPHLIQLATLERAWVIQLHDLNCRSIILQWLRSGNVTKAGFGLHDDCRKIGLQFGVKVEGAFDLNAELRRRGFSRDLGAKAAVAVLFERRLAKSGKTAKSDWSQRSLSPKQLLYAANDAYAAAVVYNALLSGGSRSQS